MRPGDASALCRGALTTREALPPPAEVSRLRELRVRELRAQAARHAELEQLGRGIVATLTEREAAALVAEAPRPVVLHMGTSGFAACEEVDEALAGCSGRWRDVHLATTDIRRTSDWPIRLGLQGVPCLAAFARGKLVAQATFHAFGWPEGIDAEAVELWMRRVLPPLLGQQQEAGRRGKDESEEEDAGPIEPCAVCGKCYPHEHVKAIYKSLYDSDEDSDL